MSIRAFLERNADFWQVISCARHPLVGMDACFEEICEKHYYGYDFRGSQMVVQFFFEGSSDYFPAIWTGFRPAEMWDQCPVYVFDLSSGNQILVGNFRAYMETLLKWFVQEFPGSQHVYRANQLLEELSGFSSHVIDGQYELKSC